MLNSSLLMCPVCSGNKLATLWFVIVIAVIILCFVFTELYNQYRLKKNIIDEVKKRKRTEIIE